MSRHSVFEVAALTHRGAVRDHNEDTVAVGATVLTGDLAEPFVARLEGTRHVVLVADGMGGHSLGELASRSAVEALISAEALGDEAACRSALAAANDHIYDLMRRRPEAFGMGTTIVGAVVSGEHILLFNVGDSRAYVYAGELVQLSHDDVPWGGAGRGRRSHLLTQCLGGHPSPVPIEPHVVDLPALSAGETLLLCSDGMTDMADDDEIAEVLEATPDPAQAVRALFDLAIAGGGSDNVSLVVVRAVAENG